MRKLVSVLLWFATLSSGTAAAQEVVCGTGIVDKIWVEGGELTSLMLKVRRQNADITAYLMTNDGRSWIRLYAGDDPKRWSYLARELQSAFASQVSVRINNHKGVCHGPAEDFTVLLCSVDSDCKFTN
ncbi:MULTISPECIES: hypothetical protein [Lysobacter]|jgi:hypothetical protein|uniref:Uncharacterized protein n=2 Tax=Lysobacter gummosus TaxID=262324 RepID=A0ABY3XBZ7_9GAMM|nr:MULTISPECIES: hypothetical protein [Lysobacter]UJB20724.1 hypothetical protein L1A79_06510 [Lysobacter capsici]UJQ30162.1 hypothetical protein L2D09_08350 [Lysobacter gummosus]UNP27950.1 hypothetical protein MOV92_15770 [Lysobacter gummosus]